MCSCRRRVLHAFVLLEAGGCQVVLLTGSWWTGLSMRTMQKFWQGLRKAAGVNILPLQKIHLVRGGQALQQESGPGVRRVLDMCCWP